MAGEVTEEDFRLFFVEEDVAGERQRHSILKAPQCLPKRFQKVKSTDEILNIVMVDASGSMRDRWADVVTGWRTYVARNLKGCTKVYIFDNSVRFRRQDNFLLEKDFTGYGTNLTAAFETIRTEVSSRLNWRKSHVNIFLITDGQHNFLDNVERPETEIKKMIPLPHKTVCVYVIGIGYEFPVNYSIDLRSSLHNGNANIPTLFWAKEDNDIIETLSTVGAELASIPALLELNVEGYVLPGLRKTARIHLGEWLYFSQSPESLTNLTIRANEGDPEPLELSGKGIEMIDLLQVFRQWNSVLIQQHRNGYKVPYETFNMMEAFYNGCMKRLKQDAEGNGVKSRLHSKLIKTCTTEYTTIMNQGKRVIDVEKKYENEIELAEDILKTTVTNMKYDFKNLRMKGHDSQDFETDLESFIKIYKEIKDDIVSLPSPTLDECCRLTHTSTLKDLQDSDFLMVQMQDKFNFLKTISMTGIPAYAPIRDASQINPWTLAIRHILSSPYDILSQRALEASAEETPNDMDPTHKFVLADRHDERTKFNIVIPLIPKDSAKILKPLVNSNIYAMLSTFCILKNPHIIDYNAHIAALGSAWISTIRKFPLDKRPKYICNRLESIIETAQIYMSRPSIKNYVDALISDPDQALMTESVREYDGKTVKSESLVKPMFFLYLKKNRMTDQERELMLTLLLSEFFGRCVPTNLTYGISAPYTEYFARDISGPRKREAWIESTVQSLLKYLQGIHESLLEAYYTLDDLRAAIKKYLNEKFYTLSGELAYDNFIAIDISKIKEMRNVGSCGDVRTGDFKIWAQEMGIPEAKIRKAASPKMVTVYVCEALMFPSSRERTSKVALKEEEAKKIVKHEVAKETFVWLKVELINKVTSVVEQRWRDEYFRAHQDIVMPLTREEIVNDAQRKDIEVSLDTFKQVYRYNARLNLLRNACQLPTCPHYLSPRRNFNQHLSVERERKDFPHALHLVSKNFCSKGLDTVLLETSKGYLSGTKNRKQPEPPTLRSLKPLKNQISELIKHYSDSP